MTGDAYVKLYRLVGYASGNKLFPLAIAARVNPALQHMVMAEVSWIFSSHFDTAVDICGEGEEGGRKNKGPHRIIQNYSENVLAVFDICQIRDAYLRAVEKIWPDHGPTFLRENDKNVVNVQMWQLGTWVTIKVENIPAPQTVPQMHARSLDSMVLAAGALRDRP